MTEWLHIACVGAFFVYAIPHISACLAMAMSSQRGRILRPYMSAGPVMGLVLGACIAAGLVQMWIEEQSFPLFDPDRRWQTAAFLALWVSNIKLEIWTLEPARKAQASADDHRLALPVLRHLYLHSAAIAAVLAVSRL